MWRLQEGLDMKTYMFVHKNRLFLKYACLTDRQADLHRRAQLLYLAKSSKQHPPNEQLTDN